MNLFIRFPFIISIPTITIATERMTKEKRIYPIGILGFTHSYIVSIKKQQQVVVSLHRLEPIQSYLLYIL